MTRVTPITVALALAAALLPGCASTSAGFTGHGVRVVAAENVWGSIARQLGGSHASVRSLIANPVQDPHSYEPGVADARTMATAQLAIVNGVGYDPWAPKLLAANPVDGRRTLTVGRLRRLAVGDNPHRWYDPADVTAVAKAITADLQTADPAHRAYFARRLAQFDTRGLAAYRALIKAIHSRYAGVRVGASESIFALLAPSLGLALISPPSFMKAVSEGAEVTASDTAAVQRQLTRRLIGVWVENSQNLTPEIERLDGLARAHHIPVVTLTETLTPATDTYQRWQVDQLRALAAALHRATGR